MAYAAFEPGPSLATHLVEILKGEREFAHCKQGCPPLRFTRYVDGRRTNALDELDRQAQRMGLRAVHVLKLL